MTTAEITRPLRQEVASASDLGNVIRQEIARAASAGEQRPGRPALVKLTGATDHQIRKVLAKADSVLAIVPGDAGEPGDTGLATCWRCLEALVLARQPALTVLPSGAVVSFY